jgi:cob(I)alamin adenosyltransferase
MKIYTKTGDDGSTGLLGGTRLPKDHIRIEAYGTLDELNAFIGVLRDTSGTLEWHPHLIQIQEDLFTIGSHLAADPEKNKMTLPELKEGRISELEAAMDDMDSSLPPMRNFVLPGGHPAVSSCHVVRCVCRRAERATIALSHTSYVGAEYVQYLNRLSDFFFVLSRKLATDLEIEETPWLPGK